MNVVFDWTLLLMIDTLPNAGYSTSVYLLYVLYRYPQGRLMSDKFLNRTVRCEPVSSFVSSYPSMSRYPENSHCVSGKVIIQRLLALSYQWRHVLATWRTLRVAWLSEQILKYFSGLTFIWISQTQAKITYTLAWESAACFLDRYEAFFPKTAHGLQPQSPPLSWTHMWTREAL